MIDQDQKMKEMGATVYEDGQLQENNAQTKDEQISESSNQKLQEQEQKVSEEEDISKQEQQEQLNEEEQNKIDWLKSFNEKFQTDYEEDQVKELFDYKTKYNNLQENLKIKDEALNKAEDPMSYFANESVMRMNEIIKQNNIDSNIASRIVNNDYSQMNNEDILVEQKLMEEPEWRGNENLLREEIQEQYNLDENFEDYEEDQQAKIKQKIDRGKKKMEVAAQKAKRQFEQMQQTELPQKQNLEENTLQQKEQYKQSAEKNVDKLIKDLEKINYYEDLEFEIDDDFKNNYLTKENIVRFSKDNNLDLSDEKIYKQTVDRLQKDYISHNFGKILNDFKKKLQTDKKNEEYQNYNNLRKNNRQEKPTSNVDQTSRDKTNEQIKEDWGIK